MITVLLTGIENGWLAEQASTSGSAKKCCVVLHYTSAIIWRLLRSFITQVGSYTACTSVCLKQTSIPLDIRSSNSEQTPGDGADSSCGRISYTWREDVLSKFLTAPSAFSFNSSHLKPRDNSFFRSTGLSEGHVSQPLFATFAGARRHLPSKGRPWEPTLSALTQLLCTWQIALILFPLPSWGAVFRLQQLPTAPEAATEHSAGLQFSVIRNKWTLCTLSVTMANVPADAPLPWQAGRRTLLSFHSENTYYMDNAPFKLQFFYFF